MSRERLRRALSTRRPTDRVLVPCVEAHAARLEQLNDDRWPLDAEAQARMLRAAQALYGLDAVTVAGGGLLVATAAWLARTPAMGGAGARAAVRGGQAIGDPPAPTAVAEAACVTLARDVLRRLRPVLGDRAGVVVVLPDPALLAAQLGLADTSWASDAAMEVVRAIAADEPDAVFLAGDEPLDPTLESLGDFFGVPVVPIGAGAPEGVACATSAELATGPVGPAGWLVTTREEIDPAADPAVLRAALARWR